MKKTYKVTRTQTVTVSAAEVGGAIDFATAVFFGDAESDHLDEDWTTEEVK